MRQTNQRLRFAGREGLLTPGEREEKLPRWTADLIGRLRAEIRECQLDVQEAWEGRDAARLATRPDLSDAVLDPYSEPPIGLGRERRVRFRPNAPDGGYVDVWVEHDEVHVMGPWRLIIQPQSGNVVRVKASR